MDSGPPMQTKVKAQCTIARKTNKISLSSIHHQEPTSNLSNNANNQYNNSNQCNDIAQQNPAINILKKNSFLNEKNANFKQENEKNGKTIRVDDGNLSPSNTFSISAQTQNVDYALNKSPVLNNHFNNKFSSAIDSSFNNTLSPKLNNNKNNIIIDDDGVFFTHQVDKYRYHNSDVLCEKTKNQKHVTDFDDDKMKSPRNHNGETTLHAAVKTDSTREMITMSHDSPSSVNIHNYATNVQYSGQQQLQEFNATSSKLTVQDSISPIANPSCTIT
jgi:hypothetical protein